MNTRLAFALSSAIFATGCDSMMDGIAEGWKESLTNPQTATYYTSCLAPLMTAEQADVWVVCPGRGTDSVTCFLAFSANRQVTWPVEHATGTCEQVAASLRREPHRPEIELPPAEVPAKLFGGHGVTGVLVMTELNRCNDTQSLRLIQAQLSAPHWTVSDDGLFARWEANVPE